MSDVIFGLDTFGDVPEDDAGALASHAQAIRQVVDEAVLADQIGVDAIALGARNRSRSSDTTSAITTSSSKRRSTCS